MDELCAFYDYWNADTALMVFEWNGSGFEWTTPWRSGVGNWESPNTRPVAGDVDGDGTDEVCAVYDYWNADTALLVFEEGDSGLMWTTAWKSGAGTWEWLSTTPVAIDADGDGRDEMFYRYDQGSDRITLLCARPGMAWAPFPIWAKTAGGWDTAAFASRTSAFAMPTSITIRTNVTTTRIGRTPVLSGAVTPREMIGKNVVVYVQKPGSARWSYSSNRTVYSLGTGAAWLYKYYFKPRMAKGLYRFKAALSAPRGYAASTTRTTVSIRVR
jgi:hypothetical protein